MILEALSNASGISGQEDSIREIILSAIEPHVSNITIDSMGNILAHQPGTASTGRPRVMLAAHMDEVGLMVTGYDSDGMLHFKSVGSIDDRILPGLHVRVGDLNGVILWTPIHKNRDTNVVSENSLRIDIGATSKSEAEGKAPRGTGVVFSTQFGKMGHLLRGKALDDRAGCSVLVDILATGPYPVDVLAAFTVQEEVGLRGATVAARALQPDVAIALETTTAHDIPDPNNDPDEPHTTPNPTCRLQAGPALTLMDAGLIVPPRLVSFLRTTAEANNIPYQFKTQRGGRTDAASIHVQNGGIPSAVISIPARYIHSPLSLIHQEDYDHTVRLIRQILHDITAEAYILD